MYKELLNLINNTINKEIRYIYPSLTEEIYLLLIYLKYLCDNNIKYTYKSIQKEEDLTNIYNNLDINIITNYKLEQLHNTSIIKLLNYIREEDIKELIYDYLDDTKELDNNLLFNDNKVLCFMNNYDKSVYDRTGNTTYTQELLNLEITLPIYNKFKLLDLCLNINNNYIDRIDTNKLNEYKYIYIFDRNPIYRYIKNKNILSEVFPILPIYNNKIILHTKYQKIAIFKNQYHLKKNLSKVMIYEDNYDTVLLEFSHKKNEEISIILYNQNTNTKEKIINTWNQNKSQKELLIKVLPEEIINNNYRIGFKIYSQENKEEITSINDLVDNNTEIMEKLNSLNETIVSEMNELIVK